MTEKFGTVPLPTPSDGSLLRVWYNPDEVESQQQQFQQPQAQQVVAFDALPNDDCVNGSLVDVNQHFVVYAVKNGLIRVLHRISPLRSLLRGHTRKITDLQFFQNGDVLGSTGGNVIVWRIFERSPEIVSEKLLEIPDTLPSISRLIWHPFNPNQFWLVHKNNMNVNVATLVETTHITTVPHAEEAHALCSLHDDYTVMDGAVQLVNSDSHLTDLCWSGRDTRHVLTTHSDGRICLWDCKTMDHSSSGLDGSAAVPAKCLFTLEEEEEEVSRCLFLPHDNVVHTTGASLTSAFVTGSNNNATITLWSAFTENSLPKKLQVFGMSSTSPTFGSYNLNQVFGPAPADGSPPSCFLLLSDRQEGRVYCVHIKGEWSDETSPKRALACGLDYVVPLSTKFPIYSWSIMATPAQDDDDVNDASLNFDVTFYAYQSKMVQKYTLPQYMLLPPNTKYDPATPGVQMEQETVEPTYEEDYELSDVEDAVPADDYDDVAPDPSSLPTPDDLEPAEPASDSNPFANWLGSLVGTNKTGMSGTQAPPPTPVTPKTKAIPDGLVKSAAIPNTSSDRAVSAPPSKPSSFLSPQELLSESKSDLDIAAGALPPNPEAVSAEPVEAKKKAKAPKEQQRKVEAKKAPNPSGPIAILKREDRAAPLPSSSAALPPMNGSEGTSIDSAQLEFVLEKVLSAHFKRQESMLVERVNKMVHTEVQTNVLPALSKTITQTMTAMTKNSKDDEKAQAKAVAKAVTTSVQQPLREAFSESMKSVLIPAYESATREMFGQIASSLDRGMAAQGASEDVSAKLDSMAFAIESLSSEVSQLRSIVSSQGLASNNATGTARSAPRPTEDVAQKVRNEVLTLLQLGQYEQAFTKAVSASAADMAVYCCENADLTDVLGGNSPALSQPILLCLMQQLGAVLVSSSDSDLQIVVAWLQEIALSLDPTDDNIERHVPGVLKQLVDSVNEKIAQGDPAMRRPLHMLLQVIRGLQR